MELKEVAKNIYENKLFPYQREGVDYMLKRKGVYEGDQMGLGKTLQTLVTIAGKEAIPCLVLCPKFALSVWKKEIKDWLGLDAMVYTGTPKQRTRVWEEFTDNKIPFLITNYEQMEEIAYLSKLPITNKNKKKDKIEDHRRCAVYWQALVCDEIHNSGLFNYKTNTYKTIKKASSAIETRILLTGTPVRQGCIDLYGPLSIIDPKEFDSYWHYVQRHCVTIQTPFGMEIERTPANLLRFRSLLDKYLIRRTKEAVLKDLPAKIRQKLFVDMSAKQRKAYNELEQELMTFADNGELIITPGVLSLMVRQRQILSAPQVLGYEDKSAAMEMIVEHSNAIIEDGEAVVVFTAFRKSVEHIEKAFRDKHPGLPVYKITGGLTAEEFGNQWQSFQNSKGAALLIVVIKSGASFQATRASTAYFLDYEFDFTLNEQAEDRLHRIGQKNVVNIYYVFHTGTIDERVASLLNNKKTAENWLFSQEGIVRERLLEIQKLK